MDTDEPKHGPIVLCILGGWGLAPTWQNNAIALANPAGFSRLWREYPHAVLATCSAETAADEPLTPEIQFATIGSGRWVLSDTAEIMAAIKSGEFNNNPVLLDALRLAVQRHRPVHIIGSPELAWATLKLAKETGVATVFLHICYHPDPKKPRLLYKIVENFLKKLEDYPNYQIASLVRASDLLITEPKSSLLLAAYRLLVLGEGIRVTDPLTKINSHYHTGGTDYNLAPLSVINPEGGPIHDRDVVIIAQSEANGLSSLIRAFVDSQALRPFIRRQAPLRRLLKLVSFVDPNLPRQFELDVAFPPAQIRTTLPEILAGRGLKQARVFPASAAEAMTKFFSGGRTVAFPGEQYFSLNDVNATPEKITDQISRLLTQKQWAFVVTTLPHADQAARQGEILQTAATIRRVDTALERISQIVLGVGGTLIVTGDRGRAEALWSTIGNHNPVPFLLVRAGNERNLVRQAITLPPTLVAALARPNGALLDVAPTILDLFGIPTPVEMTGASLLPQLE